MEKTTHVLTERRKLLKVTQSKIKRMGSQQT